MKFTKLIKNINTNNYTEKDININLIKAQYNPSRFKFWKSLHIGPKQEVLNIKYSPHYRLLKQYIEQNKNIRNTDYYKLQKLYGRNDKWIKNKINKFINLFEDIKKNGYDLNQRIIILNKPIVKNKYNNKYEIFEGHHRITCCLILKLEKIPCQIIKI